MKVSYLKEVLRAGSGTASSEDTQSEFRSKPSSSGVQLQQPIQNRFPFSTALWENQNEPEGVEEEIIYDELLEDSPPIVKLRTMSDQDLAAEQKIESDRHSMKPTTTANGEIIKAVSFTQDNPLPIRKKADVDVHVSTELKMGRTDQKRRGKEVKKDESGLQGIEDKIDVQKPQVKGVKHNKSDRIPTVEIVKKDAIQVPRPKQLSSPSSIPQLASTNLPAQELNKNQHVQQLKDPTSQKEDIGIPSNIAKEEKIDESEALVNAIEVVRKPINQQRKSPEQLQPQPRKIRIDEQQKEKVQIPSDIAERKNIDKPETLVKAVVVPQSPTAQYNPNAHLFAASSRKGETQIDKVAKDLALINRKLDEHISKEKSEPHKSVFLPRRPASHNLGGWSDLERNYIR